MSTALTRVEASAAVEEIGWRYLVGTLVTSVAVASLAEAVDLAARALQASGPDVDAHLKADVRPDRLELTLQTIASGCLTARDIELANAITKALNGRTAGAITTAEARSVQVLEIAIDALDIPAIRPFWRAVMGYVDEPEYDGADNAVIDPARQGPTIWFQQMDAPRPQRNRIHFDIIVSHDEADARVAAALAAGGHLVSDAQARAFWVLADPEGNEICVCTWQDRESGQPD